MQTWKPTAEQQQQYDSEGYIILRGLIPRDLVMEMRGVIKNIILLPEPGSTAEVDPMDPMDDSPAARAARFRKLKQPGLQSPLLWETFYVGETMLPVVHHFLGDDLLLKYTSSFLKPARTGSATPWHQDNGLWRDGETEPFNLWMALDPATKANGCLQFIPGSHRSEIVPHVLYPDSVHGELPRERVSEMIEKHGLHHVELEPGDAVCWHSSLYHYSPPNTSEQGRIGIAGVWTSPQIANATGNGKQYHWVAKAGERCTVFPPETFKAIGEAPKMEPWPRVA